MRLVARWLWNDTFVRYFAASGIALGVDASFFFALVAAGAPAGISAAAAYCIGIGVHWLVSSRAVFVDDVAALGTERTRQKFLFVMSALAGLALTTSIVSVGAKAGVDLRLTKGFAVVVSFTVNWLVRRWIVFRPQAQVEAGIGFLRTGSKVR